MLQCRRTWITTTTQWAEHVLVAVIQHELVAELAARVTCRANSQLVELKYLKVYSNFFFCVFLVAFFFSCVMSDLT